MQRLQRSAHVKVCRYVCRHARKQTDILTRIKICTYHEQYADGYEGGLVLHKYSARIRPVARLCVGGGGGGGGCAKHVISGLNHAMA